MVEATTWLLLADLMRRHEKSAGLRIAETHPGGGQYDCRTLFSPTETGFGTLAHFNLQSGNAQFIISVPQGQRLHELTGAEPDGQRLAYVAAALGAEGRRPVRKWIEARLGLSSSAATLAWSRHSLTYAVMAGVAARFALLGPRVQWENGLEDTSGWQTDDPVRPEFRAVPALAARLDAGGAAFEPRRHPAQGAWILMVGEDEWLDPKAVAVVDIEANLFELERPDRAVDLFGAFRVGGRVGKAVDLVVATVVAVAGD
jgi:hypothetical protein